MAKNDPTFHIRAPAKLLQKIRIAAAQNGRSVNEETVARLERSFGDDDEARQRAFRLITEGLSFIDKGVDE